MSDGAAVALGLVVLTMWVCTAFIVGWLMRIERAVREKR